MASFQLTRLAAAGIAATALALTPLESQVHAASKPARTAPRLSAVAPKLKIGAIATFKVGNDTFRVWVTNPGTITQLRALKAGTGTASIPNGRLLRGPGKARYNAPWKWHLDPTDIQMADVTTEVCDGAPSYVNEHVAEMIATAKRYCPWGARLIGLKVLNSSSGKEGPGTLTIVSHRQDASSDLPTTVTLAWADHVIGETGFRIEATFVRLHGSTDTQALDLPAETEQADFHFIAGGINPVKTACFTVHAVLAGGDGPLSSEACLDL